MFSKTITLLTLSILLVGCNSSPNFLTNSPPLIERGSPTELNMLTKAGLLQVLPSDVKAALIQYEKSGNAAVIESNHTIKIPFDQTIPVIYCTPLRTCQIKLEIGENVTGVYPGDTSRWLFELASSGEGGKQVAHVIFKPKDYDIVTNAIITTTKRTYNVELHSKKDVIVKEIEFYYPQDIEEQWREIQNEAVLEKKAQLEKFNQDSRLSNHPLDYHYRIDTPLFISKPVWTPVRVFNDGVHVYIQIPQQVATTALPALFTVGKDKQPELVNYRVLKPYYIVDELFEKAILQIGTGQNERHVTITYNP